MGPSCSYLHFVSTSFAGLPCGTQFRTGFIPGYPRIPNKVIPFRIQEGPNLASDPIHWTMGDRAPVTPPKRPPVKAPPTKLPVPTTAVPKKKAPALPKPLTAKAAAKVAPPAPGEATSGPPPAAPPGAPVTPLLAATSKAPPHTEATAPGQWWLREDFLLHRYQAFFPLGLPPPPPAPEPTESTGGGGSAGEASGSKRGHKHNVCQMRREGESYKKQAEKVRQYELVLDPRSLKWSGTRRVPHPISEMDRNGGFHGIWPRNMWCINRWAFGSLTVCYRQFVHWVRWLTY